HLLHVFHLLVFNNYILTKRRTYVSIKKANLTASQALSIPALKYGDSRAFFIKKYKKTTLSRSL
ncbi:hypothetical protein, partial [Lactobacillus helveticus]|uniref:hypothetical protein n=1 Tax=Lactobacillus helveticus TaxID=1587 RepID=UPI001C25E23E